MKSEKITQTFNGKVPFQVAGGYFKLLSTVSPVTVELFKGNVLVMTAAAVEGGHYQRIPFDRIEITTGANEAVSFLYAPDDGGSDRMVISGSVSVTDADRAASVAGTAYIGGQGLAAGGAGLYAQIQLWNPSAVKRVILESVWIDTSAGGGAPGYLQIGYWNTILTADVGAWTSKLNGGAAGAAHICTRNAALVGATNFGAGAFLDILTQVGHRITFKKPFVLLQNKGFIVWNGVANVGLTAWFEGYEEDI